MRGLILFLAVWFMGFGVILTILLQYGFSETGPFLMVLALITLVWTVFLETVFDELRAHQNNKD